ncbi:MAG: N-acetylglucosamine-6-phosphate deacetylase [Candidatus Eremiobacteraeota bacterium]|nr:N-acetylglucosamine-6-phosphate deacetylase [Candidatus Eremiobacteraeota bacterium]
MSMSTREGSGSILPEGNKALFITGRAVITPLQELEEGAVLLREGKIEAVGAMDSPHDAEVHRFKDCLILPGFIDIHFHGALGVNFNEGDLHSAIRALGAHLARGTTSCLPTLMTAPYGTIARAIVSLRGVHGDIPEVLGVNLEGPFISEEKKGVHDREFIRMVPRGEMEQLIALSGGAIRIVTVAPEKEGALDFISFLCSRGIIASAGHTNADYDKMQEAAKRGVRLATHLFNAMRGIHQREPGAAGALLVNDEVYTELIADGEHIHPALLTIVARTKGMKRIILVTDASPDFAVKSSASRTKSGVLVGGTLPLPGAVRNFITHGRVELKEALRTVTLNPAELLGLEHRIGSLRPGADGDIVVADRELSVKAVFLKGRRVV